MSLKQLGRYEILDTLGRGAMGVVYRARDPLIERSVAIKTIACAGLPEKEAASFEQRFFREAKSAGRLNHPNIVTIHDVGRDGELAWIAMELLHGRSLRDLLDAGAPLAYERIVQLVAAVADGLAYAHAQGIVHRDIKPANIMVLENGTVKITDFGIAQLPEGSLTLTGAVLGSPKYMSPEQVTGHKADGRSDIFALGSVLYELLTGQAPFGGDNAHTTMYQVVYQAPPAPSTRVAGLPPAVDAIVARAMAKDAAARYQDASGFAADLRRTLDPGQATLPGDAAPAPADSVPPGVTGAKRGPLLRGVLIGGAVALVATAAFIVLQPSEPAKPITSPPAPAAADTAKPVGDQPAPESATPRMQAAPGKAPAAKDWQAALQADLKACAAESVFTRVVCIEKARWRHCSGHWGTTADCPSNAGERKAAP